MTTSLEFDQSRKEILFHRALAVANDPDDRACRTKLCAEPVGDLEKLFRMWDQWGWHRVTFYGDLKEPIVRILADAVGLEGGRGGLRFAALPQVPASAAVFRNRHQRRLQPPSSRWPWLDKVASSRGR